MTLIEFSRLIANLSPLISCVGLVTGYVLRNQLGPVYKSLAIYLGLMLLMEFLGHLFSNLLFGNNLMLLHIYSFTELAFMLYLFKKHLLRQMHPVLTVIGYAGLAYIVAEMLLIFVFEGLDVKQFQPYAKVIDNFITIVFTLAFLHETMSRFSEMQWGSLRLAMVFLVFFTLNTLFFLPFNFMVNEGTGIKFYFWTGHIVLVLCYYLYLTVEIWRNGRTQTL
ncbi:MAG: hypothetical protein EOP54_30595 [Sphingobacteriales bacterium]|nr:MAG: hypothetical protein EOP54_30595 [Sphingobacteriales bacterium]